jgi:hypothetical protein
VEGRCGSCRGGQAKVEARAAGGEGQGQSGGRCGALHLPLTSLLYRDSSLKLGAGTLGALLRPWLHAAAVGGEDEDAPPTKVRQMTSFFSKSAASKAAEAAEAVDAAEPMEAAEAVDAAPAATAQGMEAFRYTGA